jgi:hypothetical protein
METLSTIRKIFAGNTIIVPDYQRAYSWVTPKKDLKRVTQTDVFLTDLEQYINSNAASQFYFGHFLFEKKDNTVYNIIDGQQRLTTIVIFLAALFNRLKAIRLLTEEEETAYEDIIKRKSKIHFSTVKYDDQLFKDYVICQTKTNRNNLETESAKRIVAAFEFFRTQLADQDEAYLVKMLNAITGATCTTHIVRNESEAIQMFIFQNNRGKKPTNLEVIKAQFMYTAHLHGGHDSAAIISEVTRRFEKIYRAISEIEYKVTEDEVLLFTLRVYFNSLWESNALDKINQKLSGPDALSFIKDFSYALEESFNYLSSFFGKDEKENNNIHSLVVLGGFSIVIPFIIKAYKFGLSQGHIGQLCAAFESIVLRHRLIGTRADITSRLNDVYTAFKLDNKSLDPIISRLNWMKTNNDWWWAYWNDGALRNALQGGIDHPVGKFILWKYENHLESKDKPGYGVRRYDTIEKPELEHIAPSTEPSTKPHGYDTYDEEFRNKYLNCLGNYMLISKTHNCTISNLPFADKHKKYTYLVQQREVQSLIPESGTWNRDIIQTRKEKVIDFVMGNF